MSKIQPSWKNYPDSPWGNVDICAHGCMREHGDTTPQCVLCDYGLDEDLTGYSHEYCEKCESKTHHIDGKCLRCKT